MAISTTFSPGSDDWTLIATVTPNTSVSSVVFSSIPVHSKLMLVDRGVWAGTASTAKWIRINNDTTPSKYLGSRLNAATPALANVNDANNIVNDYFVAANAAFATQFFFTIESANTSNPKLVKSIGQFNQLQGLYLGSAPVTRLDYILSTSLISTSNPTALELYGVK